MPRGQPDSQRLVSLAGREISIALKRSTRASVGLKISASGLQVTLPNRFPLRELDQILHQKADWIVSKLDEMSLRSPPAVISAASQIDWLGEPHALSFGHRQAAVTADTLELLTPAQIPVPDAAMISAALEKLMRREARRFLAERLALWAGRLGLQYREFKLSSAGTRWGSCTSQGVIRLNWRLMQAPLPVLDYVVIHELCHLVELNHSARFWALVASVCPDWKQKRDWLKREGSRYFGW